VHTREQLEQWIASTRRSQRGLNLLIAAGAAAALALFMWRADYGGFALFCVALVAICGYWITNSHLADWENALRELDRPPEPARKGRYQRD
jgi:hypothetical protein